jgi:hypothetical protein
VSPALVIQDCWYIKQVETAVLGKIDDACFPKNSEVFFKISENYKLIIIEQFSV